MNTTRRQRHKYRMSIKRILVTIAAPSASSPSPPDKSAQR